MIKKIFFCLIVIPALFKAQEGLRPLGGNIGIIYKDLKKTPAIKNISVTEKNVASLQIPFKDDFYYACSQSYPDQILWMDSSTYINTGHGIAPPSIGVATFDGLNKHGYPYTPALTNMLQSLTADTLRSRPINLFTAGAATLQPTDSVALTFYYQARGRGDSPEQGDSLIVDFYKPNQKTWDARVWYSKGNSSANTNDTVFKRAFAWISDTAYLQDNFQFRIRNRATTAGDFDHWHVDYVYLDKNRSFLADTTYDDIAFGYVPTPFLKNYSSMPWQQFTDADKAQKNSVFIRNNNNNNSLTTNMTYEHLLYDNLGAFTYSYTGGANPDLKPFKYMGWDNLAPHANPAFGYTFTPFSDSTEYTFKHYIFRSTSSNDFIRGNDTVIQHQKFSNYYASDDGSAEGGYYILGSGGRMLVKIGLNVPDTLRSVRIYFDPVGSMAISQNTNGVAQSSNIFRIIVWNDAGFGPATQILKDSAQFVKYYTAGSFNASPEYSLTTPMVLSPGTYYVGIQQYVASGITIGYDRNIDHSQNLFYDSGSGWNQSALYGSLMLRPVFGKKILPPVGIKEQAASVATLASVYPNPANGNFTIELKENKPVNYRLMNLTGQIIKEDKLTGLLNSINTGNIPEGVYLLELSSGKLLQHKKIIIQH